MMSGEALRGRQGQPLIHNGENDENDPPHRQCFSARHSGCLRQQFRAADQWRSEEHTSELQSLMRISYAVFCLKKKKNIMKTKIHESNIRTKDCKSRH